MLFRSLVEIAKALLFRSELIIMDEPSTALSTREIENLFEETVDEAHFMQSQQSRGSAHEIEWELSDDSCSA